MFLLCVIKICQDWIQILYNTVRQKLKRLKLEMSLKIKEEEKISLMQGF